MISSIFSQILVNIPMPPEARNWIEERLIVEDKLSEKEKKDLFEVADFLILDKELKDQEKNS
ncbi:hypothetical protein L2E68_13685 [Planktothrix agardhii 1029]|uniref:hypothetical protein n=1 Tax=Planktothrix agardhii TaxID=1160 RepID=UPI000AFF44E6|nr:hypothetical protein [Planktothrix agardhii]MCB8762561.1 hypothetical protein [Planktothrix agardhii 1809]MCF3620001.1 hypothetical protein [Planktothrix agardhii 1030]MCB8763537.1 hypothetical protein [Planktothrix agardhii 1809]MCF3578374.1 hypothetical protein [Planktothrix agardhii 1812]MCF3590534.1 hypothetical protein [Planktothrix agardhii 1029]